ncbi:hypothetical protein PG997_006864 [Apiospora hydei]|uniref:Uncharacterized protein n=1 Tax=Apiospora hydei TaxID=1337664 RepID=A0ABR1WS79_9PEZI
MHSTWFSTFVITATPWLQHTHRLIGRSTGQGLDTPQENPAQHLAKHTNKYRLSFAYDPSLATKYLLARGTGYGKSQAAAPHTSTDGTPHIPFRAQGIPRSSDGILLWTENGGCSETPFQSEEGSWDREWRPLSAYTDIDTGQGNLNRAAVCTEDQSHVYTTNEIADIERRQCPLPFPYSPYEATIDFPPSQSSGQTQKQEKSSIRPQVLVRHVIELVTLNQLADRKVAVFIGATHVAVSWMQPPPVRITAKQFRLAKAERKVDTRIEDDVSPIVSWISLPVHSPRRNPLRKRGTTYRLDASGEHLRPAGRLVLALGHGHGHRHREEGEERRQMHVSSGGTGTDAEVGFGLRRPKEQLLMIIFADV